MIKSLITHACTWLQSTNYPVDHTQGCFAQSIQKLLSLIAMYRLISLVITVTLASMNSQAGGEIVCLAKSLGIYFLQNTFGHNCM